MPDQQQQSEDKQQTTNNKQQGDVANQKLETQEAGVQTTVLSDDEQRQKEIESLKTQVAELTNNWKRVAADFANYKKQVEEEKKSWAMFSLVGSVTQFLPILDNLNSALAAQPTLDSVEGPFKQFLIGLGHIQKQFNDVLFQMGISEVAGVGAVFDPSIHESVSTDGEVAGKGKLIVSNVLTKGYVLNEQLMRPAKVVVKEVNN